MQSKEIRQVELRSDFPAEIRAAWIWIVMLSLTSVLFSWASFALDADPVYYRALSPSLYRFSDFTIYQQKFLLFHTTAFFHTFFPFTYPAPVALAYEFFFRIFGVHATQWFVGFSVVSVLIPMLVFGLALRRRGIPDRFVWPFTATVILCSWPSMLVIDRGNLEIVVWIALVIAMWGFCTGRTYIAACFFGLAAAFKLFPFVFLTLFFSTRRYKELLISIVVFFSISIAALAILGPTISIAAIGIREGINYFAHNYMAKWHSPENGVDHSIFALIKMTMITALQYSKEHDFSRELSVYNICAAISGAVLYFAKIRFLPLLNQILILSIISVYFTAFSGDGTLFHLYYAFALLAFLAVDAWRRRIRVHQLMTSTCLLAFLVSYEGFFVVSKHRFEGEVKCFALGWLLWLAFRHPFGPPLKQTMSTATLALPDASLIVGRG